MFFSRLSEIDKNIIMFITAGALSFLSAPLLSLRLIPFAHKIGAVDDRQDGRRMHKKPMARIGGVAIFVSFLIGCSLFLLRCPLLLEKENEAQIYALIFGGIVIVIGGLSDDIYRLTPIQKIIFQLVAASVAIAFLGFFDLDNNDAKLWLILLKSFAASLWILLLTNGFNLIDGLDGLSAMTASFALLALFWMSGGESYGALFLLIAALGFLPLNLRPAKLFLGDSGAMLLGFSLSILSLDMLNATQNFSGAFALILLFFLPLFDTAFAIMRRMISRQNPFRPDRKHLHHRLVDSGLSHGKTSFLLSLLGGGFSSISMMIYAEGFSVLSVILLLLLIFVLAFVIIMATSQKSRREQRENEKG